MKAYGQVKGRNFGDGQKAVEKGAGKGRGPTLRERFEGQRRRAKKRKQGDGEEMIG